MNYCYTKLVRGVALPDITIGQVASRAHRLYQTMQREGSSGRGESSQWGCCIACIPEQGCADSLCADKRLRAEGHRQPRAV